MIERPTEENPDNRPSKFARPKAVVADVFLGGLSGGIAYGISSLVASGEDTPSKVGIGVGTGVVSMGLGTSLGNLSMDEAESYAQQGRKTKSRLKAIEAIIEYGVGCGAAGSLPGIESGSLTHAVVGAGIGFAFGGLAGRFIYRDRTKPIPEPELPDNSMERDTSFPDRKDGVKLPPVYRVASLDDLKEYREALKIKLLKDSERLPRKSNTRPDQLGVSRFATAVIIIPGLQHYPALDPQEDEILFGAMHEKSLDMTLHGDNNNIVVHPLLHSEMFWPYQTIFENIALGNKQFSDKEWENWRDRSWKNGVVILAQFQTPNPLKIASNPEDVIDNYWLVDILSYEDGEKEKREEKVPTGNLVPIPNPQGV